MTRTVRITENACGRKTTFGIEIIENEKTYKFSDLTDNKEKAEQLRRNLADSDISTVHINDIIRDFIIEVSCDKLIQNALL